MRRLTARHQDPERGATAVLIALSLVVLLGMSAFVLDVATLHQERRELQSGADAGALAVAKDCAAAATCPATIGGTADSLADANADDGASNVDGICGNVAGVVPCSPAPSVPTGARYIKVTTSTVDAATGETQISFGVGRVLGLTGKRVHASAVAAWGPLAGATTIPLALSLCEFNAATSNGTNFGAERIAYFHGAVEAGTCPAGPSGSDLPGGFGWLEAPGCEADLHVGQWVDDDTGNDVPRDCTDEIVSWRGAVLLMPVYSRTNGLNGKNGEYLVAGFAAIKVTGYQFPGNDRWPSSFSCPLQPGNSGVCIRGQFTKFVTSGEIGGGPGYGTSAVRIVG